MEISWFHFLADTDLRCFEERGTMRYSLHNQRSGKIYLLNAENARRINAIKQRPDALRDYSEEELKETVGVLELIRNADRSEILNKKPFNPLFIRWGGINLAPHCQRLSRWSRAIAPVLWPCTALLCVLVIWLGTASEWQVTSGIGAAFSVEGLLLFAFITPFLKIPHELGHALVARYYNVPLYTAGIVFVGFFPLPFVDASQADVMASRAQRIRISLAGIFVDLIIAMIAFIAWHLVQGEMWKTLTVSVFTFSSLNSILFNGNPLIRLDGYYAFSDWIGRRNLSTASAKVTKEWRKWFTSFGAQGAWPAKSESGFLLYGLGSAVYKINILITILWIMLPRFFGLGLLFAVWGAYVMFFSAILTGAKSPSQAEGGSMKLLMLRSTVCAVLAALLFLPLPVFVVRTATLDTNNTYLVQAEERGYLSKIAKEGLLTENAQLFTLSNVILAQDIANASSEIAATELLRKSVVQIDPYQTRIVEMELSRAQKNKDILLTREAKLAQSTSSRGMFFPTIDVRQGHYVSEAQPLGYFLPEMDHAVLTATFPQWRLQKLLQTDPEILVRAAPDQISADGFRIIQNHETEQFTLLVTVDRSPIDIHNAALNIKIKLGWQPIYEHVLDVYHHLLRNYRQARNLQGTG